jgi:hypothetical protein
MTRLTQPAHSSDTFSAQQILVCVEIVCLVLGLFFWTTNSYMAFWLRRFFVAAAGLDALLLLVIYHRAALRQVARQRWLLVFAGLSTLILLSNSYLMDALLGRPLVHPSLLSLYSSLLVAIWLSTLPRVKLLIGSYGVIVGWAAINFMWWIAGNTNHRLGFLDSQVIYAAYLFAVGLMIGCRLYYRRYVSRRWLRWTLLFLLLCLVLSQTRSALTLVGLYLLYIYWPAVARHRRTILWLGGGLIAVVIVLNFYFSRLSNLPYLSKSVEYRLQLAAASFPEQPKKLWLGGGIGSIEWNIHSRGSAYKLLAPDIADDIVFESSHNYFIDVLVERGVVVLLLFGGLMAASVARRTTDRDAALIKGLLVFSLAYLFMNNINIQMELLTWTWAILLLADKKLKSVDKSN